ncbi:MAG: HEPN domain-containing protein [Candidatus Aminicenantes bacterium]|nr:HEPN domain-containing protein [Candidatus Aminicenantes bacterium]
MTKNLEAILEYRLQQAEDSIKEGEILLDSGGSFRSTINRSYYAMFYSVLALICKKGMGTSKHTGVLSIFDREYVKQKIFPKKMSKLFHQAFYLRQQCDYEEFSIITKEETIEILEGAKDFLEKIKHHLALPIKAEENKDG